jgi:hypothetical protein
MRGKYIGAASNRILFSSAVLTDPGGETAAVTQITKARKT